MIKPDKIYPALVMIILLFLQIHHFLSLIMQDPKDFILSEVEDLTFKKVSSDESLLKSKLLSSISFIELLVSIEEKTGKKFPQHLINVENMDTVDKIIETVLKI